ncbi:MAG: class I SAM-dependent methyltransferase [Actinomycetes bacterium]
MSSSDDATADPTGWFEPLYERAGGDPSAVPWARLAPSPHVLAWLDQPGLDLTDVDAVVVGCGLGDDAAALAERGAHVVAFDVADTAVRWAAERFADPTWPGSVEWRVADLLELPDDLVGSGGLVVEVRTVQSLPEPVRPAALAAVASLVGEGGLLLHVGLVATSPAGAARWQGPPWALAPDELRAYEAAGLERISLAHPGRAGEDAMEVVALYERPLPD